MKTVSRNLVLFLCSLTILFLTGVPGCGTDDEGSSLLLGVWSGSYVGEVDSGTVRMDFTRSSSSFYGSYIAIGRFGVDDGIVSGQWVDGVMEGIFASNRGCETSFTATLDTINLVLTMTYSGEGECADQGTMFAHRGEDVSGTWSGIFVTPTETGGVMVTIEQNGHAFTGISRVITETEGDSGTLSGIVTETGFEMTGHYTECDATFDVDLTHKAEQMDGTLTMSANCGNQVITTKLSREHDGQFSVEGQWTGTLRDSTEVTPMNLVLTQDGSTVTGTVTFPNESGTVIGAMNGNVFTGHPGEGECLPFIHMVMQSDRTRMIGYAKKPVEGTCDGFVQTIELVRQ